jgi:hypothetical protein
VFPYWLLFTVSAAGAFQNQRNVHSPVQGGPLLAALGVFVALMVGLRFEVGGDWTAYIAIFQEMRYKQLIEAAKMSDPGYILLNWIVFQLGVEIWLVNLVCGALFAWGLVVFCKRLPNPWMGFVIAVPYLVIVVAMGYTRQGVAIGLILLGIVQLRDNQSIARFAFYIFAAAAFHKTAVIVLPLVALAATQNRLILAGIGAVLGAMLYYFFIFTELDLLMQNYVTDEYDSSGAMLRLLMNLPPAALFLLLKNRFALNEFDRKLWRNFAYAAFVAFAFLFVLASSTVIDRLALYIIPLQLFVYATLPTLMGSNGRENGAVKIAVIAYSGLVLYVWLTAATNASQWLPYAVYPLWAEYTISLGRQ